MSMQSLLDLRIIDYYLWQCFELRTSPWVEADKTKKESDTLSRLTPHVHVQAFQLNYCHFGYIVTSFPVSFIVCKLQLPWHFDHVSLFFIVLRYLITLPLNRIMKYSPIPPPGARSLGFAALLLIVSAFTLSALFNISSLHFNNPSLQGLHNSEKSASHDEPRHNIWADLSVEETKKLLHYLHTVPNHLNLTTLEASNPFSNYILSTEVLRPNKSQALDYVDKRSEARPPRWAHVIIFHGSGDEGTLDD